MSEPKARKTRTPRPMPAPVLMNHRKLAALVGEPTSTVRGWIERRVFPAPHAVVGTFYLYRVADVEYYLARGRWPAHMVKPVGE